MNPRSPKRSGRPCTPTLAALGRRVDVLTTCSAQRRPSPSWPTRSSRCCPSSEAGPVRLQSGIRHDESAQRPAAAGMDAWRDACPACWPAATARGDAGRNRWLYSPAFLFDPPASGRSHEPPPRRRRPVTAWHFCPGCGRHDFVLWPANRDTYARKCFNCEKSFRAAQGWKALIADDPLVRAVPLAAGVKARPREPPRTSHACRAATSAAAGARH